MNLLATMTSEELRPLGSDRNMQIQDPGSGGCGYVFMQNIRTFGQKSLYLTKIEVLIPHHAF